MRVLLEDAKYALRALRRNPVLSAVAVLSLAIGIGANTAIFSLMDALLYRSLPVKAPERMVLLRAPDGWSGAVETSYGDAVSFSWPKYRALAEQTGGAFEGLLARFPFSASLATKSQTDSGRGEMVTGNYFDLLGVHPVIGRLIEEEDTRKLGGNPVAVLSYSYWTSRFGGDPGVLNQSVVVNGVPLTVVGVAQKSFRSVGAGESPEVFVPITLDGQLTPSWPAEVFDNPHAYWINVFGRLRPGVSRQQAALAVAPIWTRILESDIDSLPPRASRDKYRTKPLQLMAGGNGISSIRDEFELPLYLLMGMVGLVLLLACANVANLLLARAVARGKEIAIRISLGASRGRLVRQVLTESLILSLAGGVLALAVASWAGQAILALLPGDVMSGSLSPQIDGRVLLFTLAISIVTGVLFGSAPAWRATSPDVTPALKEGVAAPRGHARFRQSLVAGQIAISALLLVSAGLFTHSMRNLRTLDPGFRAGELTSFSVNPRLLGYKPDRTFRLFGDLERELRSAPGITGVSMAKWPLLTNTINQRSYEFEGHIDANGASTVLADNHVGPGFFSVVGMPMVAGREFRETDSASAPGVAVVNETFAKQYFPGRSPIGMHLTARRAKKVIEIVGVVRNSKNDDLREQPKPFVYLAAPQDWDPGPMTYYVRSHAAPEGIASSVRGIAHRLDPSLTVNGPQTVRQQILDSVFVDRMVAALATAFAVLATALAAIGLYGVVAWAVSRRRREIGIRMALGAAPGSIMRMVLGEVARLGLIGVAIAVPMWAAAGRLLRSLLFGVTERDPGTLLLAVAVLGAVAVIAGMVPAWRAARIDPISAIRSE
jgi:putative ABC transport system permease protein